MHARDPAMMLYWFTTMYPLVVRVVDGHEVARTADATTTTADSTGTENTWKMLEDICRKGEDITAFYMWVANQPCEMAYFRNERTMGVQNNYNVSVCIGDNDDNDNDHHDDAKGTTADAASMTRDHFQIGDSFPFWDPTSSTTMALLNRTDVPWWPDLCIGFLPRCYSLGDETIYGKVLAMQRQGLIPPIPHMATHIRVDCTEDFILSANFLARAIPVGYQLLEKFFPLTALMFLSIFFSMIGCTCWSCFCCCWCVRRGQLKRQQRQEDQRKRDHLVVVNPEEVNNDVYQQPYYNDEVIGDERRQNVLRQRRRRQDE